jgi:hypothetical protein
MKKGLYRFYLATNGMEIGVRESGAYLLLKNALIFG